MKKMTLLLTLLALMLSACASLNNTSDGSTQEAERIATAMSAPAATEADSLVDQLLSSYLAGEVVDTSALSPAEFTELSSRLAEKLNADRGINPVIYNNESYINPDNYMMMNYDGHPDIDETITMFHPIEGFDDAGNLQVNVNAKILTISDSAGMDWSMRITDPSDTRIDWPTTGINKDNLTNLQYRIKDNNGLLLPVILSNKEFGQVYINSEKQQMMASSLSLLIIETDVTGKPILARQLIVISGPTIRLLEEGSPVEIGDGPVMNKEKSFYKALDNNEIYYLCIPTDQNRVYEEMLFASPQNYKGIVSGNEAFAVLDGKNNNREDMLLLAISVLVKKK